MADDFITISDSPSISGLGFRHFRGESDFSHMVALVTSCYDADKVEHVATVERTANFYAHLTTCDPYRDMIFAEINGQVIGFSRGWWSTEENNGPYLYEFFGSLAPDWRRKGIGRMMLKWMEDRLRTIAAGHPADRSKFMQTFVNQFEAGRMVLLEQEGYRPIRYMHEMVRPSLDNIPDFPLPDGLEVRPVLSEHYRLIWDASVEAMRDHWGFPSPNDSDYQAWLCDETIFQPHLWQVAWDVATNQVAGQVRTFINHAENEKYGRKRGYTEFINVRRPWRRRGLARALIAQSLRLQKEQGMTESALAVDSENLSGATRLYEECGFRVVKRNAIYRKPL